MAFQLSRPQLSQPKRRLDTSARSAQRTSAVCAWCSLSAHTGPFPSVGVPTCRRRASLKKEKGCLPPSAHGIWPTRARDVELVEVGRAAGAAVKYAGSGGAVVGALREEAQRAAVEAAYAEAGFSCLRPRLAP